jgi:hypothetical protein
MVVVVVTMPVRQRDNAVIAVMVVVMMMMMVVILRDLFSALRLCRSDARVIHLQRIQCIRNRLQEIATTGRWRVLCRFGNGGLCGAHCRQCAAAAPNSPAIFLSICFPPAGRSRNTRPPRNNCKVSRLFGKGDCFLVLPGGASADLNGYSCPCCSRRQSGAAIAAGN